VRAVDLMTGDGQVPPRIGAGLFVLVNGQKDAREAAPIAALTQKRKRLVTREVELARFGGDAFVRVAEDVRCLHSAQPPG
jgi:hypothetical protein